MKDTKILIIPGWQDSGPEHWQGIWLKKYSNAIKVEQNDWMFPRKEDWLKTLNNCIEDYKKHSIVLVGHSLSCALVAFWAEEFFHKTDIEIKGALLVSPSDTEKENFPKEIQGFLPIPLNPLPFNTIVVSSENDPYVSIDRALYFAKHWNAQLINIGNQGHINVQAGFGDWPDGEKYLKQLIVARY